jgi:hypothetical protein
MNTHTQRPKNPERYMQMNLSVRMHLRQYGKETILDRNWILLYGWLAIRGPVIPLGIWRPAARVLLHYRLALRPANSDRF